MKKRTYLKRMLAMGLALAMSLSLAACGNNEDNTCLLYTSPSPRD